MIDKYLKFNSLNESKDEPKFKVGDKVKIQDSFLNNLKVEGDKNYLLNLIDKIFIIERIEYDISGHYYKCRLKNSYFNLNENILDLVESKNAPMKVRWYKKGKLK
jgi:hypothetical protein